MQEQVSSPYKTQRSQYFHPLPPYYELFSVPDAASVHSSYAPCKPLPAADPGEDTQRVSAERSKAPESPSPALLNNTVPAARQELQALLDQAFKQKLALVHPGKEKDGDLGFER
ncbi:hypothetical protein Anapl_11000 [Anas platyrhynchos]|uniref:Uncharacterized protein n=1 Tax=Anas platyrhynchos TaxID=8839 RepID=R0L220_ANAPL|nr:hypothetical protein Anapl_11000 [Anas platyrhynchos]